MGFAKVTLDGDIVKPKLDFSALSEEELRKLAERATIESRIIAGNFKECVEEGVEFMDHFHPEVEYDDYFCSPGHYTIRFLEDDVEDDVMGIMVNTERYIMTQKEKEEMKSKNIIITGVEGDFYFCCYERVGDFNGLPTGIKGECLLVCPEDDSISIQKHFLNSPHNDTAELLE